MRADDFDYDLPPELIAQHPAAEREASRLLVMDRATGAIRHQGFRDLPTLLRAGDILVMNDSAVLRARLKAVNPATGGRFEVLLVEENARNDWWVMMRPAKRARCDARLRVLTLAGEQSAVECVVTEANREGYRRLVFSGCEDVVGELKRLGGVPLPPYIRRHVGDELARDVERYQTVYGRELGSVAAPTAGLHFSRGLLSELRAGGVEICFLTLHVGPGTFAPVKATHVADHQMHEERFALPAATVASVEAARREGRRVVAVGTTTVRVLESVAAAHGGELVPGAGRTRIFLYPPAPFRVVKALLTNFHLPRSTLLMLVSAFATPGEAGGRQMVLGAYDAAVRERYRFFSYGDAMLLL